MFCAAISLRSASLIVAHSGFAEDVRAAREEQIGRAVHKRAQPAIGQQAHDAVTFPIGIEGNLVMLGQVAFQLLFAAAGFMPGGKERAFCWVAHDFPVPFFECEMRVVGADEDICHFQQRRRVTRIQCLALRTALRHAARSLRR